jgi:hypothetical protein
MNHERGDISPCVTTVARSTSLMNFFNVDVMLGSHGLVPFAASGRRLKLGGWFVRWCVADRLTTIQPDT